MKACTGPCEQGKKQCPCPEACEMDDVDDEYGLSGLAHAVLMALFFIVISMMAGLMAGIFWIDIGG